MAFHSPGITAAASTRICARSTNFSSTLSAVHERGRSIVNMSLQRDIDSSSAAGVARRGRLGRGWAGVRSHYERTSRQATALEGELGSGLQPQYGPNQLPELVRLAPVLLRFPEFSRRLAIA